MSTSLSMQSGQKSFPYQIFGNGGKKPLSGKVGIVLVLVVALLVVATSFYATHLNIIPSFLARHYLQLVNKV